MIELLASADDEDAFLELAQRIVNGALAVLRVPEVYLVHVDNWFDHKWLGWWSTWKHKQLKELYVPPFNPNRVRSQKHFLWDATTSRWMPTGQGKPLHLRQPGRRSLHAQLLDRLSTSAAFFWYSGKTVTNRTGSIMLYLSNAEGYAWYASFTKAEHWKVNGVFRTTRRELVAFEDRGRQIESLQA
jgi:hypothetical protein